MPITIGEQTLATQRPADLDEKLVEATGCTAAEHAAMIKKGATAPYQIARAVAPLFVQSIDLTDLSVMIGAAEWAQVVTQARSLLAEPLVLTDAHTVEAQ
ncbi:hypothetical protein [Sphingomonas sp. UYP23]